MPNMAFAFEHAKLRSNSRVVGLAWNLFQDLAGQELFVGIASLLKGLHEQAADFVQALFQSLDAGAGVLPAPREKPGGISLKEKGPTNPPSPESIILIR